MEGVELAGSGGGRGGVLLRLRGRPNAWLVFCFEAQPFKGGRGDNGAWIDEQGSTFVGKFKNGVIPAMAVDFKVDFEFVGNQVTIA